MDYDGIAAEMLVAQPYPRTKTIHLRASGSKYEKNSLLFSCGCADRNRMRTTKFISLFEWLVYISICWLRAAMRTKRSIICHCIVLMRFANAAQQ